LEYESGMYTLILTLKVSAMKILKFIASTVPLLVG
jgi:hypothetical protein